MADNTLRVCVQTFWTPKAGNRPDEYEDAFWPQAPALVRSGVRFRCAVADGATESSFSAVWANLLVREFCARQPSLTRFFSALPSLRQEWLRRVTAQPLPWYAEDKVRQGAFASLLGMTLEKAGPKSRRFATWSAVAVGDSGLFQAREGCLIAAFPLTRSEQFTSRPYLIGTAATNEEQLLAHLARARGPCEPGDTFYLLTDALACWLLRLHEEQGAGDPLAGIDTQEAFEALVREQRALRDAEGRPWLKNDDVTLLRVDLGR
ncbi:MAG TPA: hypothetical protein VKT32_01700 [Chthonomonadaceae bacterium]|nr:hypothetical protein [Chthonomonadaceae bacterium]